MHAPIVMQHYLVGMYQEVATPMLNMAEYVKKFMPSNDLYNHIWSDSGGSSVDFLMRILQYQVVSDFKIHPITINGSFVKVSGKECMNLCEDISI